MRRLEEEKLITHLRVGTRALVRISPVARHVYDKGFLSSSSEMVGDKDKGVKLFNHASILFIYISSQSGAFVSSLAFYTIDATVQKLHIGVLQSSV